MFPVDNFIRIQVIYLQNDLSLIALGISYGAYLKIAYIISHGKTFDVYEVVEPCPGLPQAFSSPVQGNKGATTILLLWQVKQFFSQIIAKILSGH